MTAVESPRLLPPPVHPVTRTDESRRGRRAGGRGRRSWSAWALLMVLVAGAAYGGYRVVEYRVAGAATVTLDRVTLVAAPVPVGSPDAAVVREVAVTPGETVAGGATLAVIELAVGGGDTRTVTLTAPLAGNVVRVDARPGSVVRAGESVVTLYDPATLGFETDLPVGVVEGLATGMTARITGPGLAEPVEAAVDRVVPVIDAASAESSTMTVVLVPADESSVVHLVPGVPLTGELDTTTGSGGGSVLGAGA
jgi:multidrug resistance efflux pump